VIRSVVYGSKPRNRLDLYLPKSGGDAQADAHGDKRPVVVFVTGGMWIIGYKAWGALLSKRLMEQGVLVVSVDYRNFPQGTVSDMLQDVTTGVWWVQQNIHKWGGDPSRITLIGQSAGAHLTALALVRQADKQAAGSTPKHVAWWDLQAIRSYIGLSGGYELNQALVDHFHSKGLYRAVFNCIMEGGLTGKMAAQALPRHSPESVVRSRSFVDSSAGALLPSMILMHGTADRSMPTSNSTTFAEALRDAGCSCELKLYQGKTHTDPFVEDPIKGGQDAFMEDVLVVLGKRGDSSKPLVQPALLPRWWVNAARLVMPF